MIDAPALFLTAKADVERGQAEMLEIGGIIGAGAKRAEREIPALLGCGQRGFVQPTDLVIRPDPDCGGTPRGDGRAGFRVDHVGGDAVHEMLEIVATLGLQETAAIAVGVDVDHALGLQLGGVLFGPFGRAEQHRLFGIPAGVDDGPRRSPAFRPERTERFGLRHHRHVAGQRIGCTEDPAVMVVAAQHPLVGIDRALQLGDDVVHRLLRPVGLDREMYLDRPVAAHVIRYRQSAMEGRGRDRSAEPLQQFLRVAIRHRQYRDFQDRLCIGARQAFGPRHRSDTGRQRIAGIDRHVGDRAALYAVGVARAAFGIDVAFAIAVIGRIGIDDRADRAMFLRQLRLQPAPADTVARYRDLALHIDAAPGERLVIVRQAVIYVDEVSGDVAVALEGDIGGQRAGGVGRGVVARDRWFLPAKHDLLGRHHLDRRRNRRGIEHREGLDLRVPAPFLELREHELGIGLVVRRADMVGLRRHRFQPVELVLRTDGLVERALERRRVVRAPSLRTSRCHHRKRARSCQNYAQSHHVIASIGRPMDAPRHVPAQER